ncbi:MAG: hypothetical protein U1E06_22320, partial [Tabrizicola sp.]|nr:hypothetical protein [Tabrizicola sp.]
MPADERGLVQRRRAAGGVGEEHPRARAALNPQVAHPRLDLNLVVPGVEPAQVVGRVVLWPHLAFG